MDLDRCTRLIAGFEGFRGYVYDDTTWPTKQVTRNLCTRSGGQWRIKVTNGVATVGYGETDADYIEAHWGGVSAGEALERLKLRVKGFADGVALVMTRPMTDHQHEAMTSLAYNIGLSGFYDSTVRRKFNTGDFAAAAKAFKLWINPASLLDRRESEIKHFLTPDKEAASVARILQDHLLADAHPELTRRFRAGAARFGGDVQVNSVLRDTELQRQFSNCYQTRLRTGKCPPGCERSGCAPANSPGTSNHEPHGEINKSLAIDAEPANGNWSAYHSAMKAQGLVFPISNEAWHCQCEETPRPSYEAGSEGRLPVPSAPPPAPTGPKEDELFSDSPIECVHLVAAHSQLLLTSTGDTHGSKVVQAKANGSLNQRWQLVGHEDGTVSLVNRAGDLALDRPDYRLDPGLTLQVARTEYNNAQRWRPEQLAFVYRIWAPGPNNEGTNICIDVANNSRNEGDLAMLWVGKPQSEDWANQFFIFARSR